jgi:hypothetical protein
MCLIFDKKLFFNLFKIYFILIIFFFIFKIIASPSLKGWYDASTESTNWMKNIRSSDENKNVNMQHIFINGQVSPKNYKKFKTFQNLYCK